MQTAWKHSKNFRIPEPLSETDAADNESGQGVEFFPDFEKNVVSGRSELFSSEHP